MPDSLFGDPPQSVVRIALPVPLDSLYDYAVPSELAKSAQAGCRVLVPFAGRRLVGVIVEAGADPPASPLDRVLQSIESVIDSEPVISTSLMSILGELAAEVLCPVGQALCAALPPGGAPRIVRELAISARGREALQRGAVRAESRRILELLSHRPLTPTALSRRIATTDPLRDLERDGLVVRREGRRAPAARASSQAIVRARSGLDLEATLVRVLARAPKQANLLRRIAAAGQIDAAALRAEGASESASLRALLGRGLVRIEEHRAPPPPPTLPTDDPPTLTAEQAAAFAPIQESLRARRPERFLLQGVTGSGKTEVYLRAVAEALALGRQALVLVPEITLTHQIVACLHARFGERCAVLHSGLGPSARLEQWTRLKRGETSIAVGARSALFAPLDALGVIVIDEEHDAAYKNQEGFRYHARDLATRRARAASCPLVLGTATPALETRYAADQGEIRRLVLSRRIAGRPLPAVEMVDLVRARERAPRGRKLILTPLLRLALGETLDQAGQAILFLNRRGFSTQIMCFDCGFAERCKNCDVALVYHSADDRLRCHYCDDSKPPPQRCAGCGAPDTALLGVGTQRLEEEVRSAFPEARVARLDRDSARRRGYAESVLRDLREGRLDVLIGTQLVAKGHDFPGVRLVGVIAADLALHLPDFRAAERTFQVLTQVAGRAGRDAAPGRVIVQSFVPNHYAIAPVAEHDYEGFYREELVHRAALGYPPFGRLVQVMLSGEDEARTRAAAQSLAAHVSDAPIAGRIEVLGPAPAPLARLRGRFRFQLLLKSADYDALLGAGRLLASEIARLPSGLRAALDVDPLSML